MNLEKLEKLASLAEKYDYKPDECHFNNLAAFVGINSSLIADLCKEYTTLQREITNAQEALKSAGIEADTVQAGVMELLSRMSQVAAENAALMKFCKNAAFDADYEAELGMERGGFTDAINDIKTPATDAYLTAVRADAVEDVAKRLYGQGYNFEVLTRFAAQLRAGNAGKDGV